MGSSNPFLLARAESRNQGPARAGLLDCARDAPATLASSSLARGLVEALLPRRNCPRLPPCMLHPAQLALRSECWGAALQAACTSAHSPAATPAGHRPKSALNCWRLEAGDLRRWALQLVAHPLVIESAAADGNEGGVAGVHDWLYFAGGAEEALHRVMPLVQCLDDSMLQELMTVCTPHASCLEL